MQFRANQFQGEFQGVTTQNCNFAGGTPVRSYGSFRQENEKDLAKGGHL